MICLIYKFKTSLKSNVNMRFERFVQNTTHSLILIINHVTNENKNNDNNDQANSKFISNNNYYFDLIWWITKTLHELHLKHFKLKFNIYTYTYILNNLKSQKIYIS